MEGDRPAGFIAQWETLGAFFAAELAPNRPCFFVFNGCCFNVFLFLFGFLVFFCLGWFCVSIVRVFVSFSQVVSLVVMVCFSFCFTGFVSYPG